MNNAEDDVLQMTDVMGAIRRMFINADTGSMTTNSDKAPAQSLQTAIGNLNLNMNNLFKQHNQTTQFLTYANQLWKLETYISNKLNSDFMQTKAGSSTMSTTIYVVRQRYMDKSAVVFYQVWLTMVLKRTLVCIVLAAVFTSMYATQLIDKKLYFTLLIVLLAYYVVWFYMQIDKNSRRDHVDPSILYNGKNPVTNPDSSSSSCN